MQLLTDTLYFPPVSEADADGILAIGGDLSPERLQLAYRSGIFPWYNSGEPVIWWSPDPRMVLFPSELRVSKSMRALLRKGAFTVTFNQHFDAVISNCRDIDRDGQAGTWITDEMTSAYCRLHALGVAKSVEVWQNGELAGGLYGIDLGHIFCGESMFSKVPNASKIAFIALVEQLRALHYKLIDCQVYNEHLESLGCREIDRVSFMEILKAD